MQIHTEFKASAPTSRNWSGVFGYRPENDRLIKLYGEMFAVMSISSEIDFDLSKVSGLILDELQQSYFDDNIDKVDLNTFEKSLVKVKTRIDMILEREEELSKTGIDMELAVAVIKEKILYAAVVGEAKIYISRDSDFAEVSKALIDPQMDGFMRLGSLFLEAGDRLCLATSKIVSSNLEDSIKKSMRDVNLGDLVATKGAGLLVGYELSAEELDQIKARTAKPEVREQDAAKAVENNQPADLDSTELEEMPMPELEIEGVEYGEDEETPHVGMRGADDDLSADKDSERELERVQERMPEHDMSDEEEEYDEVYLDGGSKSNWLDTIKAKVAPVMSQAKAKAGELAVIGKAKATALKGEIAKRRQQPQPEFANVAEEDEKLDILPPGAPMPTPVSGSHTMPQGPSRLPMRTNNVLASVKTTASGLFDNVRNLWDTHVMGKGDRSQMYLRGRKPGPNWKLLVLIVVICIAVIFFGARSVVQQRERQAQVEAINTQIKALESNWDALNTELATVSIGSGKDQEKENLLADLKTLAGKAENLKQQKISVDKLDQLIDKTRTAQDQLLHINAFTEPQVISDLGANFEGVDLSDIAYSNGNLYITDRGRGVIYRVGTAIKSEAAVFVSNLVQPYLIDADPKSDIVFVDNNADSAVGIVDIKTGNVKRNPGLSKARMGTLAGIDIWASNGSMYSVRPEKQAAYRQDNVAGSYQIPNESSPWRSDPDFANAVDMSVSYWMYVLVKGKGIERYLSGAPAPMTMTGLVSADVEALKNADAFEDTDAHLYIADNANKRVLVFEKRQSDAQYFDFVEQYVYRGEGKTFTQIKDLVVNEASKKMYVLDGSQIVRIDLN